MVSPPWVSVLPPIQLAQMNQNPHFSDLIAPGENMSPSFFPGPNKLLRQMLTVVLPATLWRVAFVGLN